MEITLVAAVSRNGVIGVGGALPWRLPDDLARFKALTLGKPIVMGRRTFDSIGRPLPGRTNLVMSRRGEAIAGCTVVGSVDAAIAAAGDAPELCVIGGGEIYAAFLPIATRLELTLVDVEVEGDARFPAWRSLGTEKGGSPVRGFRPVWSEERAPDARHAHAFRFVRYEV